MANCHCCQNGQSSKSVYPALAIAALAGVAFTYFLTRKGTKTADEAPPLEKVINICNSAADKLEALTSLAS